jgi:hypothetical protein
LLQIKIDFLFENCGVIYQLTRGRSFLKKGCAMASQDSKSDVFKFVSIRPPTPPSPDAANNSFTVDERLPRETPVGRFVAQFTTQNAATIPEKIKAFIASQKFDLGYPQSAGDKLLDATFTAATGVAGNAMSAATLVKAVEAATAKQVHELYTSDVAINTRFGIWDRYYAFYLLSGFEGQDLSTLTTNLRIFHLLNLLNRGSAIPDVATLHDILNATPVIDKIFTSLPKPKVTLPQPVVDTLPAAKIAEFKSLWSDLLQTHQALADVRTLPFKSFPIQKSTTAKAPALSKALAPMKRAAGRANPSATKGANVLIQTTVSLEVKVDQSAFVRLPQTSKAALAHLDMNATNLVKADAIAKLNTKMRDLISQADAITDSRFMDYAPPAAAQARGLNFLTARFSNEIAAPYFPFPVVFGDNVRGEIKPLGVGDLKVVKQKLTSYQLGEVAHIENVLRGEYKERKYRVLDRTEQTVDVTSETIQDTTKDTQTTERFELKKESESTVQEQMSVQAGVTVSGSYGMVTFGAHGDFAYSTSSQQSAKSASNFAREVVDKSVTRIQKSVKEQRITKQLHEVEEIDTHGLDNKDKPDNLTGVYRWVDKYYEAQIYNYGKRMMFEFIIPEPAAFYAYAQSHKPKQTIVAPPTSLDTLTHKDINENNYQYLIRDYKVQGCIPPPAESKVISVSLSSDAKIDDGVPLSKSSKDLVVPQGYQCDGIGASVSFVHALYPQFKLSVGTDTLWYSHTTSGGGGREKIDWAGGDSPAPFDGIIPVAIDIYDVNSYFVNIVANCVLTWQAYEAWQIQTFEKINAAYQALKATYDQQIAAQQTQQGVVIHGQNPLINRQIEKMELKKGSVKLLMDTWRFGTFGAMKQNKDNPPDFDIHLAVAEGKTVQFFEQAFEWQNITYLFYPYIWGRQSQWLDKINNYDEDPLFTQFLQAGSSRVVVPVHPGYKDAVLYFLENNGAIWNGGDPPRLNDPLYISLAEELRDATDDLQNAIPEGDSWQVILPTTLVYLQKDSALPTYS